MVVAVWRTINTPGVLQGRAEVLCCGGRALSILLVATSNAEIYFFFSLVLTDRLNSLSRN